MHQQCCVSRAHTQMWWGDDWRLAGSILDNMLISLNLTSPGRVRAVTFLKTKYSTITALNKAWYVSLTLLHTLLSLSRLNANNFSRVYGYRMLRWRPDVSCRRTLTPVQSTLARCRTRVRHSNQSALSKCRL
jgi:hypothetical protein